MNIRAEEKEDMEAIRRVNEAAFGRPDEATLVDQLREVGAVICSLVAEVEGEVVGHILFSPAELVLGESVRPIAALGPMAVLPAWQRRGVGSQLIPAGLALCRAAGYDLVIVLGHTGYYPRFGFRPAAALGIRWEHGGGDHFMAMALPPGAGVEATGVARYRPEFDGV